MRPYKDIEIHEDYIIREFDENVDPVELMWHRDNEDRIIESIGPTDWRIQLDNRLPIPIFGSIIIPRHVWHRAIRGTGKLRIKIYKT